MADVPESAKERDKLRDAVASVIDPKPFEVFDAEWRRTNGLGVTHDQLNVIGKMTIAREKADAILALLSDRLTRPDTGARKAALEEAARAAEAYKAEYQRGMPLYGAADKDAGRGRQEGHVNAADDIALAIRALKEAGHG